MGVAATPAPWGLKPQNSAKKFAHVGVLSDHLLSQNHVPKVSDPAMQWVNIRFNLTLVSIFTKISLSHSLMYWQQDGWLKNRPKWF